MSLYSLNFLHRSSRFITAREYLTMAKELILCRGPKIGDTNFGAACVLIGYSIVNR